MLRTAASYDLPRLVESHLEGKVQAIFPKNSEIADDKGVYTFIPEMIRRYVGEEPVIPNVETAQPAVQLTMLPLYFISGIWFSTPFLLSSSRK